MASSLLSVPLPLPAGRGDGIGRFGRCSVKALSSQLRLVVALWLACMLSAGCAKPPPAERVPFSEAMRERYRLDEADLRGLQYYISNQIVLERAVAGGATTCATRVADDVSVGEGLFFAVTNQKTFFAISRPIVLT